MKLALRFVVSIPPMRSFNHDRVWKTVLDRDYFEFDVPEVSKSDVRLVAEGPLASEWKGHLSNLFYTMKTPYYSYENDLYVPLTSKHKPINFDGDEDFLLWKDHYGIDQSHLNDFSELCDKGNVYTATSMDNFVRSKFLNNTLKIMNPLLSAKYRKMQVPVSYAKEFEYLAHREVALDECENIASQILIIDRKIFYKIPKPVYEFKINIDRHLFDSDLDSVRAYPNSGFFSSNEDDLSGPFEFSDCFQFDMTEKDLFSSFMDDISNSTDIAYDDTGMFFEDNGIEIYDPDFFKIDFMPILRNAMANHVFHVMQSNISDIDKKFSDLYVQLREWDHPIGTFHSIEIPSDAWFSDFDATLLDFQNSNNHLSSKVGRTLFSFINRRMTKLLANEDLHSIQF